VIPVAEISQAAAMTIVGVMVVAGALAIISLAITLESFEKKKQRHWATTSAVSAVVCFAAFAFGMGIVAG
jgi:hypothetical protein